MMLSSRQYALLRHADRKGRVGVSSRNHIPGMEECSAFAARSYLGQLQRMGLLRPEGPEEWTITERGKAMLREAGQ